MKKKLSPHIDENIQTFKQLYSIPENADVVLRTIHLPSIQKKAAIIFIKTISNTDLIDKDIIKPLQEEKDIEKQEELLNVSSLQVKTFVNDIADGINQGLTAIITDTHTEAFLAETANFAGRSIDKPETEKVVKGPKEAFNELVSTNISMVRKKIRDEKLVFEKSKISKRSENTIFIAYIKGVVDEDLLTKVKKRVNDLDVNMVQNLSLLEQYIEDRPFSILPTVLYTERPDRAAAFIQSGYIAILMDNSPDCLIAPATFWSFFHGPEDQYLRFFYGNFTRVLRIISLFVTLFTSAIYIALTNFHSEMIPPDLLLAIAATRERVPFPIIIEVLVMELAFELIREAGIRVPAPIGPTIGIVGALILGQAAVQANVVSPIIVIVVALGGLSSFVIGDISLNFAVRISRYFLMISAFLYGIYGLTAIFTMAVAYLVSIKSFGISYLAPLTPSYQPYSQTIFRGLLPHQLIRAGFLKLKDAQKKKGEQE
ncbi:spore germination protein [Virgibacillus halophilus]